MQTATISPIAERIAEILERPGLSEPADYRALVEDVTGILLSEDPQTRPVDRDGLPGGLLNLRPNLDTIVVPDLHARMDFIYSLCFFESPTQPGLPALSVLDRLAEGSLQIVCVGDGMHAERRAAERWILAQREYMKGFRKRRHMDEEMRESLGLMEMVLELKRAFPDYFHYLKGNHDNIKNERGNGNFPFMKFALEGPMVTDYLERFYGPAFLGAYDRFEKNLPLLARGKHYLISHAEPVRHFRRGEVVNYRHFPDVVTGLTWTGDDYSEPGSVHNMILEYIHPKFRNCSLYFGGHRPVAGLFSRRAGGRYVQVHNPDRFVVTWIPRHRPVRLERDVFEIENLVEN